MLKHMPTSLLITFWQLKVIAGTMDSSLQKYKFEFHFFLKGILIHMGLDSLALIKQGQFCNRFLLLICNQLTPLSSILEAGKKKFPLPLTKWNDISISHIH